MWSRRRPASPPERPRGSDVSEAVAASGLERLLQRDRAVALAALALATAAAWGYLLLGAGMPDSDGMTGMDMTAMDMAAMASTPAAPSGLGYFALVLVMWSVMMPAMMLPGAAPMILLFGTVERKRRRASPTRAVLAFASAYVLVWLGFSIAAALLQWLLHRAALASPAMAIADALLAGGVLTLAGLYQFTPLKRACLRHCRSPLEFIGRHWSEGPFATGLRHGLYCLGCCWMLMALLFVGGAMNLLWVAAIAALVLVEKAVPRGDWAGYAAGAALTAWGAWVLYMHALGGPTLSM